MPFAGNIPEITLPIGRIYKFNSAGNGLIGGQQLKRRVSVGRVGPDKIPSCRFDLEIKFPVGFVRMESTMNCVKDGG